MAVSYLTPIVTSTGGRDGGVRSADGFIDLQRIAVRIRVDPGQPPATRLRPGMSVETRVETD